MHRTCIRFVSLIAVILLSWACNNQGGRKGPYDTPTSGTIYISADESFKPIIDSEVKVFESSFPDAKLVISYKPEADCFRDLIKDSTRMIIVTRGLSREEDQFYRDSIHYAPLFGQLAYDAVAVIVNNKSKDTIMNMDDLRALLAGKSRTDLEPVMDGVKETSTVRYLIDSVMQGQPLGKQVVAARSSQGVLNYVAQTPNAVGFIGVSWIGDQDDTAQIHFLEKVKVVALKCGTCLAETYVKLYPANIALKRYPMVRGLFYILKENWSGLGNNFVNFLQYERGQLIFRRAYLIPSRMNFEIRDMQISN